TCALGDVAPNSSVTIMANYTVPATTPPGDQTNVVTVSSATLDLNPENNTASDTTTVTQAPLPGQQPPAKWTGGGTIAVPDGNASFGFNVQRKTTNGPVSGQLEFNDHAKKLTVHSTSIDSLTVSGNTATFSGSCQESQKGSPKSSCTFTVTVQDNGKSGDTFRI